MRLVCALFVLAAALAAADGRVDARRLAQDAEKAEQSGDLTRAFFLFSQAVAGDPYNLEYHRRRELLRVRVALEPAQRPEMAETPPPVQPPAGREALPPVELSAAPGRQDLELRGDARYLFTEVARAYQLGVVFDADYQAGAVMPFRAPGAGYREALHALSAATGSFVVPVGERLVMVARDTPQKRSELEPVVSVSVPVPSAMSDQEAQEIMNAARQTLALTRVAYDSKRQAILLRDRLSLVRPAQRLVESLAGHRVVVSIQLEFMEQAGGRSASHGASLQTLFPLVNFGRAWNSMPGIPSGFTKFLVFGGGRSLLGLGVADARMFARMTESSGHSLFRTEVRSLDRQRVTVHVGDKYPVLTGRIVSSAAENQLVFPPTVSFEDLGLSVEVTPRANGSGEVTLELEAEFKALTGQVVDDIPVIANRRLQSTVRLRSGEWAVIAGLMSSSQARTISGLAGFSRIPVIRDVLGSNTRDRATDEVVVILKPTILGVAPQDGAAEALWVGTDLRPRVPL
ncbi:MAG: type II and III secretion system protein [Bryobacterales bacterium]|nr:type II and III secretion system protein [Bryobacterales bacterium]